MNDTTHPCTATPPRRGRRWPGAWAALLCLLLAGAGARAQAPATCPPTAGMPTPQQMEAATRQAADRGFLWRISRDGRTSHLYGTVHVARLDWLMPGRTVHGALMASDTIALELDVQHPDIVQRLQQAIAARPDAPPLPAALAQRLKHKLLAECLPLEAMERMAPEIQVMALATLIARRDGLDPAFGVDAFLAGFGRGARKQVVSLETPEAQIAALRPKSEPERLALIERGLALLDKPDARAQVMRLVTLWVQGDQAMLDSYADWCECMDTPADRADMARLNDDRNPALADGIAALHASGKSVFAAVGSLHMTGPKALPALMAERGFTVERVAFGAGPGQINR